MTPQAAFLSPLHAHHLAKEVDVDFRSNAWDEATRIALEKIAQGGVDCFGGRLDYERPIDHDRVLSCLSQSPMRLRQIAVRCQAKRDAMQDVLDTLLRWGRVQRDEEAFYSLILKPVVVH